MSCWNPHEPTWTISFSRFFLVFENDDDVLEIENDDDDIWPSSFLSAVLCSHLVLWELQLWKSWKWSSLLTKVCFGLALLETIKSLIEKAPPHPIEINYYVNFPFFTWTVSSGLLTRVSVVKTRPGIITFESSAIWGGGGYLGGQY